MSTPQSSDAVMMSRQLLALLEVTFEGHAATGGTAETERTGWLLSLALELAEELATTLGEVTP